MNPIHYGQHHITDEDIKAVNEVLKSRNLTQGPKIAEFEEAFAKYIGVKYAIAVTSGTAALHLSTISLGLKEGEKVITTPMTFAATANCIRYAGGEVVFSDIDPSTYLLDIRKVRELLESSDKESIKGIIPVDYAGRAVDLEAFHKLAKEYGCWIIEDACHAPGGYFKDSSGINHNCGNADFADLSIFSFHPVKHIATGEGGMVTTNNEELYHKLRNLRTHGIQQIPELRHYDHGPWYYEMQDLGFNYRLTDIQAALGISQLKRAEQGLTRRREIAKIYDDVFRGKSHIKGQSAVIEGHAYHLYVIEVENRDGLYKYLRENDIFAQVHYIPVHYMPYYEEKGWNKGDLPFAENFYDNCLSLPIYPTLSEEEQDYVISKIKAFFGDN